MFDINQQSLPTPFDFVLGVYFCLKGLSTVLKKFVNSPPMIRFLTLLFWPYFYLTDPFSYISLYQSFNNWSHRPGVSPRWGYADAEIKDLSVGNPKALKPGVGQNIAMYATSTARDFFLEVISNFRSIHFHFFSQPLPIFFPCVSCC